MLVAVLVAALLCAAEATLRSQARVLEARTEAEAAVGVPTCGRAPEGAQPLGRLVDQIANARVCLQATGQRVAVVPLRDGQEPNHNREVLAAATAVEKSDQSPGIYGDSRSWPSGVNVRDLLVTADVDMNEADDGSTGAPLTSHDQHSYKLGTRGPVALLAKDWAARDFLDSHSVTCAQMTYGILSRRAPNPETGQRQYFDRLYARLLPMYNASIVQAIIVKRPQDREPDMTIRGLSSLTLQHTLADNSVTSTNINLEARRLPLGFEWHEVTRTRDAGKRRQLFRNGQDYTTNSKSAGNARRVLAAQGSLCSEFMASNPPLAPKVGNQCGDAARPAAGALLRNPRCYCFAISREDHVWAPREAGGLAAAKNLRVTMKSMNDEILNMAVGGLPHYSVSVNTAPRVEVMRVYLPDNAVNNEFIRAVQDAVALPPPFRDAYKKWFRGSIDSCRQFYTRPRPEAPAQQQALDLLRNRLTALDAEAQNNGQAVPVAQVEHDEKDSITLEEFKDDEVSERARLYPPPPPPLPRP
jgi:hypothetical protein